MNRDKSGMIVRTKAGKLGRTFHSKGIINGKIPVYLATKIKKHKLGDILDIPIEYDTKAILCKLETLTIEGYID